MSFKKSDFSRNTQLGLLLKVIVIILLLNSACSTNAVKWDIYGALKVKIKSSDSKFIRLFCHAANLLYH